MFDQEKDDTILDASYEVGTRKGQVQEKQNKNTEKAAPEFRRERATFQELQYLMVLVSLPARKTWRKLYQHLVDFPQSVSVQFPNQRHP